MLVSMHNCISTLALSYKPKMCLTYDLTITLWTFISEKWKFTYTWITINKYDQSSFIFNCEKPKSVHTSFTGESNSKLRVVYTCVVLCGVYRCHAVRCSVAQLRLTLCYPMDLSPPGSSVLGDSPGKNTRVGCHALLQGIFPTQVSNPGLPHFRWIL